MGRRRRADVALGRTAPMKVEPRGPAPDHAWVSAPTISSAFTTVACLANTLSTSTR